MYIHHYANTEHTRVPNKRLTLKSNQSAKNAAAQRNTGNPYTCSRGNPYICKHYRGNPYQSSSLHLYSLSAFLVFGIDESPTEIERKTPESFGDGLASFCSILTEHTRTILADHHKERYLVIRISSMATYE